MPGHQLKKMKRAFSLLELMVVIAIMAMMGVAASAGHKQMIRGMRERGAVASATAILRTAKERAAVDRQPTVVFCYNRCYAKADDAEGGNAVVCGEMVAVRRGGRLSAVRGRELYDEFADLLATDDVAESMQGLDRSLGIRLFRFGGTGMSEMRYSVVAETVIKGEILVRGFSVGQTNVTAGAYYNLHKSEREPSGWKAGDPYGLVFAELTLPVGFIFGQEIPTEPGRITTPKVLYFDPENSSSRSVDVWATRPNASGTPEVFRRAGEARSDEIDV